MFISELAGLRPSTVFEGSACIRFSTEWLLSLGLLVVLALMPITILPGSRELGLKIWLFVGWPKVCLLGDKYLGLPCPPPAMFCPPLPALAAVWATWGRLSTLLCLRLTTETLAWWPICWWPSETMLDLLEEELLDLRGLPDCWWIGPGPMLAVAKWSWLFDMFLISMWTLLDGSDLWLRSDWLMDLEILNKRLHIRYSNTPRYAPPRYANPADTPLWIAAKKFQIR